MFRQARIFKWSSQYSPMRLVASEELRRWAGVSNEASEIELPKDVNYLLGYHPHGPLATGGAAAYGNDSLGFSKLFPGIKPYLATVNLLHYIPFHRDYVLYGGKSIAREIRIEQIYEVVWIAYRFVLFQVPSL